MRFTKWVWQIFKSSLVKRSKAWKTNSFAVWVWPLRVLIAVIQRSTNIEAEIRTLTAHTYLVNIINSKRRHTKLQEITVWITSDFIISKTQQRGLMNFVQRKKDHRVRTKFNLTLYIAAYFFLIQFGQFSVLINSSSWNNYSVCISSKMALTKRKVSSQQSFLT